jgi:hypothetical protein
MSIAIKKKTRNLIIMITFFFFLVSGTLLQGQYVDASNRDAVKPPDKEKFVESTEVVIPWRSSDRGCDASAAHPTPDCPIITVDVYKRSDMLTLYNSDGTLWYRFSISPESQDYFLDNTKMAFKPFAPRNTKDILIETVVLRLVGESGHWYKVEVNEKTQDTKFILKSDPMWTKTTWSFLFNWSYSLIVDQHRGSLCDKPDGEVIKEYTDLVYDRLKFMKLHGDWVYVEGIRNIEAKTYYGWIRWRKGRDILVGSILNRYKVPETPPDENEP